MAGNTPIINRGERPSLGSNGIDVFRNGATPDNELGNWVALQCVGVAYDGIISVHAECAVGENLADDGSTGEVTLVNNTIVYGQFNKLVSATIGAGEILIAYRA
jgi:hypothetical protein